MFKKNKNKKKPQAAPSASDIARQAELQEENEAQKAFLKRWIKEVKRRKGEKLWNARMLESYTSTL